MREFAFECHLCAHLEATREGIVGRQLGGGVTRPGSRIVDIVHVAPGPEMATRARIGPTAIPRAALEADVGVGRWRPVTSVLPGPPERARELADRAVDAGFFERTRRDGDSVVRQATTYPDWFGRLTAIENKPDLSRPGAMAHQLRFDIALGLFDRVILATSDHVTGAHLNRLPAAVGVWRFQPDGGTVTEVRAPRPLNGAGPSVSPGTEIQEEATLRTEVDLVGADAIRLARRRVAERAWGQGWRPDRLPECARCEPTAEGLPHCTHFGRVVEPTRECGTNCPGHEPAEPPPLDQAANRAARTPWNPEAPGVASEQASLEQFGEGESS
ncbi:MAG: DUF5787 family protein [Halobacteriaceae archaeon]